jgi:SAM-dependent methyltransferase
MTVRDFYDQIAPFYHLIYGEWDASVQRQAQQIHDIITGSWQGVKDVLDVSCGIGTQAIGLAKQGYRVTGIDIAPRQIERARKEAARYQVSIDFHVADMREADSFGRGRFDLVLSADNAIPHLLTDDDILDAMGQFHACLRPGGGLLISVRDYDGCQRSGTRVVPFGVREEAGVRYLVFQVWKFDGACYDLSMYFVEDRGGEEVKTHVMRSRYYAISIPHLVSLITAAGFRDVRRLDDRFFQPVLVATRP